MNDFVKVATLIYFINSVATIPDSFNEELLVTELKNGFVALHFNFVTKQAMFQRPSQHFHLFPMSVSELMNKYMVNELHLSLARGFWDSKEWGYPFVPVPSGAAELWTWFKPNAQNVDDLWHHLTQSLSGQFCASLNQLADSSHVTSPRWSYRPEGLTRSKVAALPNRYLRYGQLPHETVCTENLTPWAKLLPCKRKAGLAELFNTVRLFETHYHALTLTVRPICWNSGCSDVGVELRQTLTLVMDRRILASSKTAWSLKDLLDTVPRSVCPLATKSRILVIPTAGTVLTPPPTRTIALSENVQILDYDLREQLPVQRVLHLRASGSNPDLPADEPPVVVTKYATGVGNVEGGVRSVITSKTGRHLTVVYTDHLPWYMQLQYRTVKVEVNGHERKPRSVFHRPSQSRSRPAHLELMLDLPAGAQVTVSYQLRKHLQRWNEFPPDANHGFYLPAATVSFQLPASEVAHLPPLHRLRRTLPQWAATYGEVVDRAAQNTSRGQDAQSEGVFIRLHTETVLVTLATPDFSMPFNVLCLVCSVVAIGCGSVHKYTVGVVVVQLASASRFPVVKKLKDAVVRLLGRGGPAGGESSQSEAKEKDE